MTVLTDDLIEKAAEAIELVEAHSSEAYARACLTAVLPDVVGTSPLPSATSPPQR
jgi:hypothetical protein